ncbi:YkvA family protein [Streptomyces sp. NBC_00344]|uniref:YkvA family protein n=1 Tax=Streptomyces sp. NBC_00344 TaxID=2975720 RepID=UPI002E20696A
MSTSTEALLVLAALAFLATLVLTVVLAVRLFRARRYLREAGIPLSNKFAFWGALIYTISPVDLLPDPVLLDDIGVLLFALHSLEGAARRVSARHPGHAGLDEHPGLPGQPPGKFGTVGPPAP